MADQTKVLIVEDDENMRTFLSHFIRREDMQAITLEDGQAVKDFIANETAPDIALVDLHLPYISGFDLIQKMRSTATWKEMPIIVISSETSGQSVEKALSMGADDYVEKPIEIDKTLARMKRFLP